MFRNIRNRICSIFRGRRRRRQGTAAAPPIVIVSKPAENAEVEEAEEEKIEGEGLLEMSQTGEIEPDAPIFDGHIIIYPPLYSESQKYCIEFHEREIVKTRKKIREFELNEAIDKIFEKVQNRNSLIGKLQIGRRFHKEGLKETDAFMDMMMERFKMEKKKEKTYHWNVEMLHCNFSLDNINLHEFLKFFNPEILGILSVLPPYGSKPKIFQLHQTDSIINMKCMKHLKHFHIRHELTLGYNELHKLHGMNKLEVHVRRLDPLEFANYIKSYSSKRFNHMPPSLFFYINSTLGMDVTFERTVLQQYRQDGEIDTITDKYDRRAYRIRTVNIEDLWIMFHDTMVYGTWVTKKTYEPELLLTLVYRRFNNLAQVWDVKSEILNPK
ncbi:hypothetical protein CRE_21269 [Caenorhabditis remanei]|uniref:DUF38 domain-containing protein n=1 Tax=Caenorhabditis remanei TaxID=31234 RepID=E3MF65_CAERE|nr:hypothetical protein CRE_21269 [Caenorhabditis remanei]